MVRSCKDVEKILGSIKFGGDTELRRSLYYAKDLKAGTVIKEKHLKTARPALGLSPIMIDRVLGKKLKRAVRADEPVENRRLLLS